MEKEEVVLNLMYNGIYLHSSNNIGFEIINLYKTDQNENYIYLLPYGTFDKKHTKIKYVLLVRKLEGKHVFEVLGKAERLQKVTNHAELARTVSYGGVPVSDIFRDSEKQEVWCTFKADLVVRPSKKIYLVYSNEDFAVDRSIGHVIRMEDVNFSYQAQKRYFASDDTNNNNFCNLKDVISKKELWLDKSSVGKIKVKRKQLDDIRPTMFDLAGIADRELSFSHAFNFFITKYPELLVDFVVMKGFYNIKLFNNSGISVVSESECNIDLLIKTENYIIVVENKIRSGINGIDKREDERFSQLDKYYNYIENSSNYKNKFHLYVILRPDYSNFDLSGYQEKIPLHSRFKDLRYSEVYKFLKDKISSNNKYKKDWQLNEFVKAMERHTKKRYDDQLEVMEQKFKRVLLARKKERR